MNSNHCQLFTILIGFRTASPAAFDNVLQIFEKLTFWLPVISSKGDLILCDLMILPNDFCIPNFTNKFIQSTCLA